MLLFKPTTQWRTVILFLAIAVISFTSSSCNSSSVTIENMPDSAEFAEWGRRFGEEFSKELEKHAKETGQNFTQGVTEEVLKALKSIPWEQYGQQVAAGIRQEFEKLFDEKIKPLLTDIDLIVKERIDQVDSLIEEKLNQADKLIQATFNQFQTLADQTLVKLRTDIINYAFDRFATERDKTVAQIRAEVIDYAALTVDNTTTKVVAKVNEELIDHTFSQFDQLRQNFRQDINQFFDRAEKLLDILDCTEEKTRIDMENLIKKLGEEWQARCPWVICGGKKKEEDPIVLACYQKLELKRPPKSWQYWMIYRLEKCEVLSGLTNNTSLENVVAIYLDLHNQARRIACIQRSPDAMWDSLEFKSRYQFWSAQQM